MAVTSGPLRFVVLLSAAASISVFLRVQDAAADQFAGVGSMAVSRSSFTATALANGKVLVAGGDASDRRAEVYDPVSRTFAPTAGLMTMGRIGQTATLLPSGKVLIAGGEDSSFSATATAEVFDPNTGMFSATVPMTVSRAFHTATLLPGGKVLIVGGFQFNFPNSALTTAELYDPSSGTFTATASMTAGRVDHTATLLGSGAVLIAGGYGNLQLGLSSAELYDPSTTMFSPTGAMISGRGNQTATLLANGRVLVAGGYSGFPGSGLAAAEMYDPSTGTFASTGSMTARRGDHTATLLPNGEALIVGGFTDFPCTPGALPSAELYDATVGAFTATASMQAARGRHAAALLGTGDVLVAGGLGAFCAGPFNSAELYSVSAADQPIAANGTSISATEGTVFSGTVATFTDPDPNSSASEYSATIDWGDGTGTSAGTISSPQRGLFSVSGSRTYAEEGSYTIKVTNTDLDNAANTATVTVTATVSDAALSGACATPLVSGAADAGPTATFSDQSSTGGVSDFSATINWGDGSSSPGVVTGGPGNAQYTVSGAHTYATPGFYTISTTIRDVGGTSLAVACTNQTLLFPPSTQGCDIDGSGLIKAANRDRAVFLVDAEEQSANDGRDNAENRQTYRDMGPVSKFQLSSTQLFSATCNDDKSGGIYGRGTLDGITTMFFIIDVTSGSGQEKEEGGHRATYRIRLSNGYDSGQQKVREGEIQIQIEHSQSGRE